MKEERDDPRCCSDRQVIRTWKATLLAVALLWIAYYWLLRPQPKPACRKGGRVLLEQKWLPCSVSASGAAAATLHFVTPFSRSPETTADVIRTAQALTNLHSSVVHWVLLEVVRPGRPRVCSEGIRAALDGTTLEYSYIVQGVEDTDACLAEEEIYRLGSERMAHHLASDGVKGIAHFGRMEATYPLDFFEEVRRKTRRASAFPVVVLLGEEAELFGPVTYGNSSEVHGFVGNTTSPFFPLSLAFNVNYLRDPMGLGEPLRNQSRGLERPAMSDLTALDEDKALVMHTRTRRKSQYGDVRAGQFAGADYNVDRLLADMVRKGIVEGSDAAGKRLRSCSIGDCQYIA